MFNCCRAGSNALSGKFAVTSLATSSQVMQWSMAGNVGCAKMGTSVFQLHTFEWIRF